jgi:hypothetical protein
VLPVAIAHMMGAAIGLILLVALLGVMFYCARMLLPLIPLAKPFRTILRVLIILLAAIRVLLLVVLHACAMHRGAVHRWLREKPSEDPASAPSHIGPVKL